MDLKLLESEYDRLNQILGDSLQTKESTLWEVCYRWWSVYRVLNEQVTGAKSFAERDEIIGSFATFQRGLVKDLKVEYTKQGIDMDKVEPLDDMFDTFPKHMKDIILVMRMQRSRFIDHVKLAKSEKQGKGAPLVKKLARKKRKWLKS